MVAEAPDGDLRECGCAGGGEDRVCADAAAGGTKGTEAIKLI